MKTNHALAWIQPLLLAACLLGCGGDAGESTGEDTAGGPPNGAFTATLNGFDIDYEIHGRGPVLMTVPNSWGLSLEGLREMYRPLEEHLTMVYFDPRGMGRSSPIREEADMGPDAVRADFDALRRHLGLERVDAIGWSNGASNLILLAAEYPDSISSAVLLHGTASFLAEDAAPLAEKYPDLFRMFGEFTQEMTQNTELTEAERNARVKRFNTEVWFPLITADPVQSGEIIARTFRDAEFSWAHSSYTQSVWPTFDARDKLPQITSRTLVIAGAHDMLPLAKGEEMHAGLADSELVVFDDSGHFAPLEEPDRFVSVVLDFLGDDAG